jgi:hypothetical protein
MVMEKAEEAAENAMEARGGGEPLKANLLSLAYLRHRYETATVMSPSSQSHMFMRSHGSVFDTSGGWTTSRSSVTRDGMKKFERAAWVLLVAIVAAWGAAQPRQPAGEAGSHGNSLASKSSGRSHTPEDAMVRSSAKERGRASAAARTRTALGREDPLERLAKFLDVLSDCDAGELAKITGEMEAMRDTGMHLPLEERLLHFRAGQLKGSELLSQRRGSQHDREELDTITAQFEGWLQADGGAATRWLETLPEGRFRDQLAIAAIAATAATDPAESLLQAATLHPSQQKSAGQNAASKLLESGPLETAAANFEAMRASAGGANSGYLGAVFGTLLASASERDQAIAVSLAESHVHEPYADSAFFSKVSAKLAGHDPAGALAWALKIEGMKGEAPGGGVAAAAIRGMDLDHLAAAEEWSAAHANLAGVDRIVAELGRRRNALEDRGSDDGGYDRDD